MQNHSKPAAVPIRSLIGGVFCVAILLVDNGLRGGVASGWALRNSLFRGVLAAVPIAVLFRVLLLGDAVQKILAALVILVPVLELFTAFLIAADW